MNPRTIAIIAAIIAIAGCDGAPGSSDDSGSSAPTTQCFVLSHVRTVRDPVYGGGSVNLTLTGIVTNKCAAPVAPRMVWTGYYEGGDVIFTSAVQLPEPTNIVPGKSSPFQDEVNAAADPAKSTLKVIGVQEWP